MEYFGISSDTQANTHTNIATTRLNWPLANSVKVMIIKCGSYESQMI